MYKHGTVGYEHTCINSVNDITKYNVVASMCIIIA